VIHRNNPGINDPNHIVGNVTVTDATVDMNRPAGCYDGNSGFMAHGATFTRPDSTGCRGTMYTCQDGELLARPYSRCLNVPSAPKPILRLSPR
jgi:hypothetical protein